jgi:DNA-binding CsgD family transcriptional regulator
MNKIAIVHNSEIIRKGLNTIIKSVFNLDVFQFNTLDDFKDYTELHSSLNILIINEMSPDVDYYKKISLRNNIRLIGITSHIEQKNTTTTFDSIISIFDTSHKIKALLSGLLKSEILGVQEKEGEELTQREKDVLRLVALGHANKEIADKLFISIHTVISHRKNITEKLGIKSISGLTVYAILNKLIDTDNLNPENLI